MEITLPLSLNLVDFFYFGITTFF